MITKKEGKDAATSSPDLKNYERNLPIPSAAFNGWLFKLNLLIFQHESTPKTASADKKFRDD
ncbi:MAG: hypothetical protein J0L83_14155 [Chitinophagales bacterium]|nr:hypothetical protein [Chitinophagales bacterium]